MTSVVVSARPSGWLVRADGATHRVRRSADSLEFLWDDAGFTLERRNSAWRSRSGPAIELRSRQAGDNVRRRWEIKTDTFRGHACERSTGRAAVRQLGEVFSVVPFHFVVPTTVGLVDETDAEVGTLRSRWTFPIGFGIRTDDDRLDAQSIAAFAVIVGAEVAGGV